QDGFDLAAFAQSLREGTSKSLESQIQEVGARFARKDVGIDRVLIALNRLFEVCLPVLESERPKRATLILGLVRLHALISLLLAAGYTAHPMTESLVEASLAEAEHRAHQTSAYVTRIYERERRRLSHDLHDEVGHDLILLKLYLEMISMGLKPAEAAEIGPR